MNQRARLSTWVLLTILLIRSQSIGAAPNENAASKPAKPAGETPLPTYIKVPWTEKNPGPALPENDSDYNSFYRRVPKPEYPALRDRFNPLKKDDKPYVFQKTDYPTGEENPTTYRFDMGPLGSPTAKGFRAVTRADRFSWEKGWGWEGAPKDDFAYTGPDSLSPWKQTDFALLQLEQIRKAFVERGKDLNGIGLRYSPIAGSLQRVDYTEPLYGAFLDDVSRDAVLDPDELVFKVALPNGTYSVSMILGDVQLPRYGMDVYANGRLVASDGPTMEMPWPRRVTFTATVVRNNLRLAVRPNDGAFLERAEVAAEPPDYNFSELGHGWVKKGATSYFGKQMNANGPPTQMAIAGICIWPRQRPPLELIRQKLIASPEVKDRNALKGVEEFNAGNRKAARESFERIPDSEYRLKACALLGVAGHLETEIKDELPCIEAAITVLEKGLAANPGDAEADDLLRALRVYRAGAAYFARQFDYSVHVDGLPKETIGQDSQFQAGQRLKKSTFFTWFGPGETLYIKSLMLYARYLACGDPHRWTPCWQAAEDAFIRLQDQEPGNRFSEYFLHWNTAGWDVPDYSHIPAAAPKWAVMMHEAYNRLLDQADWWHDHRQRPDSSIGGGWGDDVECNQDWEVMALINPDADPKATELARSIADGVWWSGEVDRDAGFYDGILDNEHVAEWTGDTQPYLIAMDYGNPLYFERCLKTGKLMRDVWFGKTPRGHTHFKSMTFGNKAVGTLYEEAFDCPLNARATGPAFWAWWYSPLSGLEDLFGQWASAWLEDCMRTDNGKPAGVIPSRVGFEKDTLGGNGATNWREFENPGYVRFTLGLFSRMYVKTGDPKWLEPKAMRFGNKGVPLDEFDPVPNTTEGTIVEDKYALLKELELEHKIAAMRTMWPMMTSENGNTDRIGMPGLNDVYRLLAGGNIAYQGLDAIPMTLEKTSRQVAYLNLASDEKYAKTIFYNFSEKTEPVNLRLWKLRVGAEHEVTIGVDKNDDDEIDEVLKTIPYRHVHRGDSVEFTLAPHKAVVVEVKQTKPGDGMPKEAVDLGLAAEDIDYKDGRLSVTAHNIGNKASGPFTMKVWEGEAGSGKLLETFQIEGLEAPNDLEPRTVTRSLDWKQPSGATLEKPVKVSVELEPEEGCYEITEHNNVKSRSFPYRLKPHEIPRMWKSLAAKYGMQEGEPFPQGEPVR